jgi:hypothetical protein
MRIAIVVLLGILMLCGACTPATQTDFLPNPGDSIARVVYFYAEDCALCVTLFEEVLQPLMDSCGTRLELKAIQVDTPAGYEVFVDTEKALIGEAGRWDIPTIVVGDTYFIGEDAIRDGLIPHLLCVFGDGGNTWPEIESLTQYNEQAGPLITDNPFSEIDEDVDTCISEEESAACASPTPIFVLYLSAENCEGTCDRIIYDLRYLKGFYPQLFFEEKTIQENINLARALASKFGLIIPDDKLAPALVVGTDYLTGNMMTLDNLKTVLAKYKESGTMPIWYTLDVQ